ncbi:ABC transporter permease [Micromonospora sp. NPDC048830]|uniref:ABC transporter permease n=1 Tax=Micromonospora sp. NPDC048830 TaxID=3364257 RepID=UPI003714A585
MRDQARLMGYAAVRLLQALPLILGVVCINFLLVQLAPGDPVTALVGDFPAPPEYVAAVRAEYGLDEPLYEQLLLYLRSLLQGDLGYSFAHRESVASLIGARIGPTLLLVITAMGVAAIAGVLLGVLASVRQGSTLDSGIQFVSLAGYAIPVFWLGQILVIFLSLRLGWFPTGGMGSIRNPGEGFARVTEVATYLVLPAFALSCRYIALNMRITRTSMLETLRKDFVVAARARGMSERAVVTRHGLRNALLPVVTVIGYNLGFALSGSVLIETVFNWPGLGSLLFEAVTDRDYPVLLGVLLVITLGVVVANLVTDLVYAVLDPRIRY